MPEITFIFGPDQSFFFDCPKTWKFHNIPQTLRQLFNSSMSPAWRVAQPHCLALAPHNNSPESIWYIGCKTLDAQEKIFYSQTYFDVNYPDLSRWTKTIPNAHRSCFVTFGTGYSYFACAPGRGSVWADIPSDLSDKVQKAYDTPSCVSLGLKNAWFVMWPDGYYSWKFYGQYGELDKVLTYAAPRSVSYLAISPYNMEQYFVAFRDRTIKYNFTGAPREWMQQIQEVFHQWQAEIARAQAPPPQSYMLPNNVQYAQWNTNLTQPQPPLSHSGFMSPQTPNTPMSLHSNASSPPLSPNPPAVFAHRSPPPAHVFEMMGDAPQSPSKGSLSVPTPPIQRSISTEKKKKFLSRIFN